MTFIKLAIITILASSGALAQNVAALGDEAQRDKPSENGPAVGNVAPKCQTTNNGCEAMEDCGTLKEGDPAPKAKDETKRAD